MSFLFAAARSLMSSAFFVLAEMSDALFCGVADSMPMPFSRYCEFLTICAALNATSSSLVSMMSLLMAMRLGARRRSVPAPARASRGPAHRVLTSARSCEILSTRSLSLERWSRYSSLAAFWSAPL